VFLYTGLSDTAESIPNPTLSFFLKLIGASQSFRNMRGVYSPGSRNFEEFKRVIGKGLDISYHSLYICSSTCRTVDYTSPTPEYRDGYIRTGCKSGRYFKKNMNWIKDNNPGNKRITLSTVTEIRTEDEINDTGVFWIIFDCDKVSEPYIWSYPNKAERDMVLQRINSIIDESTILV